MIRSFLAVPLFALFVGAAACSSGDAHPANAADAADAPGAAADRAPEAASAPAPATGTARIRISGAQTADLEGEAHFAHGEGLAGETVLNLNLTAVEGGVVHIVSVARPGEALPGVGSHPLVGIDTWGEEGTDPGAALASYAYGRGTSAEALAQDVTSIIDSGWATGGELTLTRSTADRMTGTLRFRALLDDTGGEVTVEAEFDAPRVAVSVP